jgi:hypothetical protein
LAQSFARQGFDCVLLPPTRGRIGDCKNRGLANSVERMPSVAGERPHLARPAPRFDRSRPFAADQNMRAVDLIKCAVARAVMGDPLFFAADAHGERLALHARDGVHARHFQEIGHVLSVVNFVEERFLVGGNVHAGDEQIGGCDRH